MLLLLLLKQKLLICSLRAQIRIIQNDETDYTQVQLSCGMQLLHNSQKKELKKQTVIHLFLFRKLHEKQRKETKGFYFYLLHVFCFLLLFRKKTQINIVPSFKKDLRCFVIKSRTN